MHASASPQRGLVQTCIPPSAGLRIVQSGVNLDSAPTRRSITKYGHSFRKKLSQPFLSLEAAQKSFGLVGFEHARLTYRADTHCS
jgi:hypothetical protein